ncbi:heat shock protein [Novymonas esmeraldas]|uniref:Heat shock protein n=1 Tax=Novymonas esmeraldas TaxID=1808958 RepID=A0AAW0F0C6_9TRYP
MLRRSHLRSAAAVSAVAAPRSRQWASHRVCVVTRYMAASRTLSCAAPALVSIRRWCATAQSGRTSSTASSSSTSSSTPPKEEGEVIRAAKWRSSSVEERLGFEAGETITEERLKRHYYILAKHYHPDAAGSSGDNTGAFQSIKDAYDEINAALKTQGRWSGGDARGSRTAGAGYEYSDEARRRSQMRLLGDAVLLFVFMTLAFIFIVSRHNKSRMQSRYLWHLVWIFFMIQLFPRLLAAAILFAAHSTYLLENTTLQEQAAIALTVERTGLGCAVRLEGIRADAQANVVVQVTTTADTPDSAVATTVASTLTFDRGVTAFTLPLPLHPGGVYHIKAVDEARKVVLVDRTLTATTTAAAVAV